MRIAMIGTGGFARAHLKTLVQLPDVDIVGHVSRTPQRREAAAREWGGSAYGSCEELLDATRVDAAWITVPPGAHGQLEECLIGRGIPFFVEKPLSADRSTGERIGSAIAERQLIVGVGYNWRAMDTIPEVRKFLAENTPHLILAAWHGSTPPPSWWQRQETSGGQMVEQATHLFDIARHLVGEAQVLAATADHHERADYPELDVATTSSALLRFDSGAKGVFTATCLLDGAEEVYLKLVCDGALITITRSGVLFEARGERRALEVNENPIAQENRAFLDAVGMDDPSLLYSSYEDALQTHRLCFDVVAASNRSE